MSDSIKVNGNTRLNALIYASDQVLSGKNADDLERPVLKL